jgi:hypothetical protein
VIERVVSASERLLKEKILTVLKQTVSRADITTEYALAAQSGNLFTPERYLLLINAVAPHHISVSSKYVSFADMIHRTGDRIDRFAVHDRPLDQGDVSLLQQVADIVPFRSLGEGIHRLAGRRHP